MKEVPECLRKRYKVVDKFIQDLSDNRDHLGSASTEKPGVDLMCNFWNILKQEPDINLTQAVRERMELNRRSDVFRPPPITCYLANEDEKKRPCCSSFRSKEEEPKEFENMRSSEENALPLGKVLCDLKQAVSFEKKCKEKVSQLEAQQTDLQDRITELEKREKQGLILLKQADCMWTCMEETYKRKLAESLERQKALLDSLKEVEKSNTKWRKLRSDLEFQINNLEKSQRDIVQKINQKSNDVKTIDSEIKSFKTRIESNEKDLDGFKKQFDNKKATSDKKLASIASKVKDLQKQLKEEQKRKTEKETEGNNYIREARDDLQNLCKTLLQKRLENEDLSAEREALFLEVELLKQTCDQCKDKCKNKEQEIEDQIKKMEEDIAGYKAKCIQCHQCTDTVDVRKMCTDCPRCIAERECNLDGDHCTHDSTMDCVCMAVKQKFLNNVFENMYTCLERQTKTPAGQAVADTVVNCLKRSRNGKLNEETKKILQEFILTVLKKNLNMTVVGGAVKTRCEMDPDTYQQLMLCLKSVEVTKPSKTEKGVDARKEPCSHWGGTNECHCPKGPKNCICAKKALRRDDSKPCPESTDPEDKRQQVACPHKGTPCGADCAMHGTSSGVADVTKWIPDPCQEPTCQFKNLREVQCVLGPEGSSTSRAFATSTSFKPSSSLVLIDQITCKCGGAPVSPCPCKDPKHSNTFLNTIICDKATCVSEKNLNKIPHNSNAMNSRISEHSLNLTKDKDNKKNVLNNRGETKQIEENYNLKTLDQGLNKFCCKSTKLTKTSSGNLELTVDKNLFNSIDSQAKENQSFYINLKRTSSSHITVDFERSESSTSGSQRILVSRNAEGKLLLSGGDKSFQKIRSKSLPACDTCKEIRKLTQSDIIKLLLNISKRNKSACKNHKLKPMLPYDQIIMKIGGSQTSFKNQQKNKNDYDKRQFAETEKDKKESVKLDTCFLVKLEDVVLPNKMQCFMVAKTIDSGKYRIVFDKEFEKILRQTISGSEGDDREHFIKMYKISSQQYILDLKNDRKLTGPYKYVILVKSPSGDVNIISNEFINCIEDFYNLPKSVLSLESLERIINKLFPCKFGPKKKLIRTSESLILRARNSYLDKKMNYEFNKQNILSDSDRFNNILDEESKLKFIENLKIDFNKGSQICILVDKTPDEKADTNLNHNSNVHHKVLEKTHSHDCHISVIKNGFDEEKDSAEVDGKFKTQDLVSKGNNLKNQAISTTCNAKNFSSCNISKCMCQNVRYKFKNWIVVSPENYDVNQSIKENYSERKNFKSVNSLVIPDTDDPIGKCLKSPHGISPNNVAKPCGCYPEKEVISGPCNENCKNTSEELGSNDYLENRLFKSGNSFYKLKSNWDALEFLPPQLPLFLRN